VCVVPLYSVTFAQKYLEKNICKKKDENLSKIGDRIFWDSIH